jgi:hypothetical protein
MQASEPAAAAAATGARKRKAAGAPQRCPRVLVAAHTNVSMLHVAVYEGWRAGIRLFTALSCAHTTASVLCPCLRRVVVPASRSFMLFAVLPATWCVLCLHMLLLLLLLLLHEHTSVVVQHLLALMASSA